jgi:predicted metal-dependent hydrolase
MTLPQPVFVVIDGPPWAARAAGLLRDLDLDLAQYHTPAGPVGSDVYIEWLIARWVVVVLVDGTRADWRSWVAVSKTEQATRRIPLLVIGADPAHAAGADGALAPRDLDSHLEAWVRAHGRLIDPAWLDELACQCQDPLPPLAQEGVRKFNAGAYYAQHDAFEAQWMAEPGPVRELYRAILQVGVAYYHLTRGNYNGGLKMLRRSVQWLALLPDVCQGVDVARLRADSARVRAALLAMDPAEVATIDRGLFRPLVLERG